VLYAICEGELAPGARLTQEDQAAMLADLAPANAGPTLTRVGWAAERYAAGRRG
jgi:hypothetical protein